MTAIDTLATASLTFTAVKVSFAIVQWVVEKKGDKLLRMHLDALWDRLNRLTLRQLAHRLLSRTVGKSTEGLLKPGRPRKKLLLAFLLLNVLAYLVAESLYCAMKNNCGVTLGHDYVLQRYGASKLLLWLCLNFTGSLLIQLVCLFLIHRMLEIAVSRFSVRRLVVLLIAASLLMIIVFFAQYSAQQLSTYLAFREGPYWDRVLSNVTQITPYFLGTLVLSLAAGLPLVAYVLALLVAVVLRTLPDYARTGMIWVVYKVSSDDSPVLERMGYLAGGIASLSSAISNYVKA